MPLLSFLSFLSYIDKKNCFLWIMLYSKIVITFLAFFSFFTRNFSVWVSTSTCMNLIIIRRRTAIVIIQTWWWWPYRHCSCYKNNKEKQPYYYAKIHDNIRTQRLSWCLKITLCLYRHVYIVIKIMLSESRDSYSVVNCKQHAGT